MVQNSPSVQMHDAPGPAIPEDAKPKEEDDPDVRISQDLEDKMVEARNEFYDGDKDNDQEDIKMREWTLFRVLNNTIRPSLD